MRKTLPIKMAYIGCVLGILSFVVFWWVRYFNPFDLPSSYDAAKCQTFSAGKMYFFINNMILVMSPGHCIQILFLGSTGWLSFVVWGMGIILNGVIFYCLGHVLAFLGRILRHMRR